MDLCRPDDNAASQHWISALDDEMRDWRKVGLPAPVHALILREMFLVNEADAAAIRTIFDEHGELSAAIELRRRFPGITDNAKARECARTIAGWKPALAVSRPVARLQPGKRRSAG